MSKSNLKPHKTFFAVARGLTLVLMISRCSVKDNQTIQGLNIYSIKTSCQFIET